MSPHLYKCDYRIRKKRRTSIIRIYYQMFPVLSLEGRIVGYFYFPPNIFYVIFLHFL